MKRITNNMIQAVKHIGLKLVPGMCGFLFSEIMFHVGARLGAAGHGVYVTYTLIGAPYEMFYFIWPIIFLVASFTTRWCRLSARIVSATQMVFAVYEVFRKEDVVGDFSKALGDTIGGVLFVGSIIAYVAAHVFVWVMTAQKSTGIQHED